MGRSLHCDSIRKRNIVTNNFESKKSTAIYVEKMCVELRKLSADNGLDLLAYLLDVAREEAAIHVAGKPDVKIPDPTAPMAMPSRDQ